MSASSSCADEICVGYLRNVLVRRYALLQERLIRGLIMTVFRESAATPVIGSTLPIVRIGIGVLAAILIVGLQSVAVSDAPIRFAPSLMVVALGTWYWGYLVGAATLTTSAVSVNYALLHPRWLWSATPEAMTATAIYLAIGIGIFVGVGTLRNRMRNVESDLANAKLVSETEIQLRRNAEDELHCRLAEMEQKCAKVLDLAQSSATNERYAANMEFRIQQLNDAFTEFPVPMALLDMDHGMPEFRSLRAVNRSLKELANISEAHNAQPIDALGSIVTTTGSAYPSNEHPLVLAARGAPVCEARIGWVSSDGQLRKASLYAARVAQGRVLAMAVVPMPWRI